MSSRPSVLAATLRRRSAPGRHFGVVHASATGSSSRLPRRIDGRAGRVMRTIEDYYWRRASAALSGDAATIFVERMRNLWVTDVRFEIEEREPVRVYVK